jgi:uncharacterized membrane protein
MKDVIDVPGAPDAQKLASLKQLTLLVYVLYAVSFFVGGVTALAGIIINYVKLDDARGTLFESHFTWQIRTFWWGLLWAVLGFLLIITVVGSILGVPVLLANFVWCIYRIVKGLLNWNDGKPMAV